MPCASARVRVTLPSAATPPCDITRLCDTAVCDRLVLDGRLVTGGGERESVRERVREREGERKTDTE